MRLAQAPPIGIAGVSVEVGDRVVTSEEFSRLSGLPRDVIEEKLGFTNLRRWSGVRDDQTALVDASVRAIAGLDPRRLDLIVCLLHPFHWEADVYGLGVVVKERLGAVNAEVTEVLDTCASVTLALQMCRELFLSEPRLHHALIVGLVSIWNLLDYGHPATRWASAISDGLSPVAASTDGEPFALTYAVLLAVLVWQWSTVYRTDAPEYRPGALRYLVGLVVSTVANTAANRAWTFQVRGTEQMARQHVQALVVFAITWVSSSLALELLAVAWPQASTLTTVAVVGAANAVSTVARFTAMRSWIFRIRA